MRSSNIVRETAFGIEGTGSYGAGARFLTGRGYSIEVNRPDRSVSPVCIGDMSRPFDADRRAVLGVADSIPKSGEGEVEMIRMLKSARDSAVKARAVNQMKALVVILPSFAKRSTV